MFPGMPDFSQLLAQAQQMQSNLERAQSSLADEEVTGTAGGGLVRAVLSGNGELRSLTIDPSVVDPADIDTLTDLIVAAVRHGKVEADKLRDQLMGGLTGDLGASLGGLPGLAGLPGLGGVSGIAGLPVFGSPAAGADLDFELDEEDEFGENEFDKDDELEDDELEGDELEDDELEEDDDPDSSRPAEASNDPLVQIGLHGVPEDRFADDRLTEEQAYQQALARARAAEKARLAAAATTQDHDASSAGRPTVGSADADRAAPGDDPVPEY